MRIALNLALVKSRAIPMKLIQRTTLIYQEGNSDKVYEVDLCQTGEDLYVVNFRYGRRGTNLKEGVKV